MDLNSLFVELETGFYVVPETQRYFVWKNTQIRDLINSIYNLYPIGSIIVWEMPKSFIDDYNELVRPLDLNIPEEKKNNMKYMIIDGQQRLTSLLLIKKGSIRIASGTGQRDRKVELFFNPIDGTFELGKKSFIKDPKWFNVTEVLNAETVNEVLENKAKLCGDDSIIRNPLLIKGLERLRHNLSTYDVPIIKAKLDYSDDPLNLFEKISKIFVTINSKGTRIKMFDLIVALIGSRIRRRGFGSFRDMFQNIQEELEKNNFSIGEPVIMRLYLAVATNKTKFKDATKELDEKNEEELLNGLNETKKALENSLEFLRKEVWILSSDYLQSHYLLVPLGYFLHKEILSQGKHISENVKRDLIKWFIFASINKRYTGRLETDLYEDVSAIANGKGVRGLLDNLVLKSISPDIFEGSYDEYHLTLLMALYHELQTKDWNLEGGARIPLIGEIDPEHLEIHHIFPKDILVRVGKGDLADDVANITIISREANRKIGNELPLKYLKELYNTDPELLKRHFIPTNEELWEVNNYEKFLIERKKLILEKANDILMFNKDES
jgi:hypothetical protein